MNPPTRSQSPIKSTKKKDETKITNWWFQTFLVFTSTWGNDPIWLIFFRRVETTNQIRKHLSFNHFNPSSFGTFSPCFLLFLHPHYIQKSHQVWTDGALCYLGKRLRDTVLQLQNHLPASPVLKQKTPSCARISSWSWTYSPWKGTGTQKESSSLPTFIFQRELWTFAGCIHSLFGGILVTPPKKWPWNPKPSSMSCEFFGG